jgi:Domain of unknown function (DUF4386)
VPGAGPRGPAQPRAARGLGKPYPSVTYLREPGRGLLGLIGGSVIFASPAAVLFGLYEQVSVWGSIAAIPVFAWEMSLAVWLIVKGFKPSAIACPDARQQHGAGGAPAPAAVAG